MRSASAQLTGEGAAHRGQQGHLDVLVHSAGVLETELDGPAALRSFDTNAAGIARVTQAALSLLRRSPSPNVVTISSSMGSFWG
jgi:NAD(P)-dependent dehydrogenase (short-subunit alcohol dehydrogenase family)